MNQDQLTKTALSALAVFAFFSLGCINLFDDDPAFDRPDLSGLECGEFQGEMPMLGYGWDEYEPLGQGCEAIPIEPGFQGGFHITPVVWMPIDMQTGSLTGVGTVRLSFPNGELAPIEQPMEVFGDFWRPEADGNAMETRIILPNAFIGDGGRWDVQLDFEIEFDDPMQQPISVSETTQIYLDPQ